MSPLPPPPKFEKKLHHVVPVGWQRRFSAPALPGPYYKNILTGNRLGPEGPGQKMAEEYVNIIFDEYYRPSDAVEDRLARIDAEGCNTLDRIIASSIIESLEKVELAYFLAIQSCRYPELYSSRLDLGKFLAIAITEGKKHTDVATLNLELHKSGLLPGAALTASEFKVLSAASDEQLAEELDEILTAHGYESFFNVNLVLDAALKVAEHIVGLEWHLIQARHPAFILSDRPTPPRKIGYDFSVGLSANLGLRCCYPSTRVDESPVVARSPQKGEISQLNAEVRSRAREWICGPDVFVHSL